MHEPIICAHCGQPINDFSDCIDAYGKSYHETCFMNCAAGIMLENGTAGFRNQIAAKHDENCIKLVNLWQKNQNEQEIARMYINTPKASKHDAPAAIRETTTQCGVMYHNTIIPATDCPSYMIPWYVTYGPTEDGIGDASMSRTMDDACTSTLIMPSDFGQMLPDTITIKFGYDYEEACPISLVLGYGVPGSDYDDTIIDFFTGFMTII